MAAVTCAVLILPLLIFSMPGCCFAAASATKTEAINFTASAKPTYQSNINALLNSLSQAANQSAPPTFYHTSVANDTSSAVYGLYLCRGDVTDTACRDCVNAAASALSGKCTRGKQAVVWYDQCIIRYSNKSFLGRLDTSNNYTSALNSTVEVNSVLLNQVLSATATKAASGSTLAKFATEQTELDGSHTVNVEGQCTPDLTAGDCNQCLSKCIGLLPECCANKQGGRVLFPSCNLRYQLYLVAPSPAPQDGIPPPTPAGAANQGSPGKEGKPSSDRRYLPGIISGSVLGVLMLFLTIALWFCLQQKKAKRASEGKSEY
ncbi:hypothetical protein V2J09_016882 [Rumex salicifolius]